MLERREGNSELTDALEMYIKTIYEVEKDNGAATVTDIAQRLKVRAPSVTAALQRLSELGMVEYQKYRAVTLTRRGRQIAKRLMRTHDILQELFTLLGVDSEIAEIDACEIEHMIHQETFDKVESFVRVLKESKEGRRLIEKLRKTESSNQ